MLGVYFEQNVTTERYEDPTVTAGSLSVNKGGISFGKANKKKYSKAHGGRLQYQILSGYDRTLRGAV